MDISILRKKPQDRVRTVPLFGDKTETADVLFCGRDEMKTINEAAQKLIDEGNSKDDAYNLAYGRVALRGWEGLTEGGSPLPFTPDNIDLLMLGSAEFRTAVITAASSLKVGLEKN
jgi:hypothetical protein